MCVVNRDEKSCAWGHHESLIKKPFNECVKFFKDFSHYFINPIKAFIGGKNNFKSTCAYKTANIEYQVRIDTQFVKLCAR